MSTGRRLAGLLLAGLLCWGRVAGAAAQTLPEGTDQDVLFRADSLTYDRERDVVTAEGHVEIVQGARILRADTVSYDRGADRMTASGEIVLLEPSGEVLFADHAVLSGDLKTGAVDNIRMLLTDDSRMAAVDGRRIGGTVTELNKAVYSPCRTCLIADTPLWQIKAVNVTHNQAEKLVEYRDAWLEFGGIPVAYTPYLSHPDPTVKRKSGFLVPSYGSDSELGLLLEVPYYFNIAPDKDATFSPIITGKQGPVLAGEYRQRFTNGALRFDLSGTRALGDMVAEEDRNRGHLFAETRFDLDDTWRAGADAQFASDDTYLRRYNFSNTDQLTSQAFLEGFRGRDYARAESFFWRGLRADDDPGRTPIIVPLMSYNHVGSPDRRGGRWRLDASALNLIQTEGADSRRLALRTGWELPHIASTGEVYRLYADLRTDGYWVDDVQVPGRSAGDPFSGVTGRVMPRIGLDWRFPLARTSGTTTQIIEPVAGVTLSPNGGNPDEIPNQDSRDFELDSANLLNRNRFTGVDRVEGGQRAYYGLRMSVVGLRGASSAFIGQGYRLRDDSTFQTGSGFDDHFSDIVGRVDIRPRLPAQLQYRFRIGKDDFRARRSEVLANLGPPAFQVHADYVFFDQSAGSAEFGRREEITAGFRSRLTRDWSISASTRRDLERDAPLSHQVGLRFICDCFTFDINYTRTFTEDRDIRPSETVFFRLVFKNLGTVATSAGITPNSTIASPFTSQ